MGRLQVQHQPNLSSPKVPGYTRLVCLSDTHGLHRNPDVLQVPAGDVLIHAGDIGLSSSNHVAPFDAWLQQLPHSHKVLTFGNMDPWAESRSFQRAALPAASALLLSDSAHSTVGGFRFVGSPFTPEFYGSFQLESEAAAEAHWSALLPPSTRVDILVTHGPPAGTGDVTRGRHVGDRKLLEAFQALQEPPALWLVGHIHASYGVFALRHERSGRDVIVANVATNDLRSGKDTPPMVFDVRRDAELS